MRTLYTPQTANQIKHLSKNMSIEHNVTLRVLDENSGDVLQTHEGHNAATNSMLTGISHYLAGDGTLNQAQDVFEPYVPRYLSLGTMGLFTQEEDNDHLPLGLGSDSDNLSGFDSLGRKLYYGDPQTERLCHYLSECPGFGSDGYDESENNGRPYFGLGPKWDEEPRREATYCELITDNFLRAPIAMREIVPESQAEIPKTLDIVYSGMVSVGSLSQFRGYKENGEPKDYIFVTEAGLWSSRTYKDVGNNGLLAGYRIVPPNQSNWDLGTYVESTYDENTGTGTPAHYNLDETDPARKQRQIENQKLLRQNILRVGRNQVVQIIWKIQIGGLEQLGGMSQLYPSLESSLVWHIWD